MDEIIRLEALDGTWEVGGADRKRGIWPEDLQCTWDDWGPRTASFTLRRDSHAPQPDLSGLTPVIIEKGGGTWEGFIDQVTVLDANGLGIECIGWPDYAGDDVEQKTYVHDDLSAWTDIRSRLDCLLAPGGHANGYTQAASLTNDPGGLVFQVPANTQVVGATRLAGAILDLGENPESWAERVYLEWEHSNNSSSTFLFARGSTLTIEGPTATDMEDIIAGGSALTAAPPPAVSSISHTMATPCRYITVFLYYSGATSTFGDLWCRIRLIRVFTSTAYESGSKSILKASDVLKDSLPRLCPLWSQDLTGIDATLLSLPHLAPTEPRSFRELTEGLNALHNYVRKLEAGRRFRFKPQPTVPLFTAGRWEGLDYKDTAKNTTRDIYNKAIGNGSSSVGGSLRVVRYSGQLASVVGEVFVSAPNPSFDTDTSGWTLEMNSGADGTFTRSTTTPDTSPACGRFNDTALTTAMRLTTTLSGTFKRGVVYRLFFSWRQQFNGIPFFASFGVAGDLVQIALDPAATSNTWQRSMLAWIPSADRTSVQFRMWNGAFTGGSGITIGWTDIDSILTETARPTLLDKRGRVRSKIVSLPGQAVDPTVLTSFCDVFLQSHMRTRARGELTVDGDALKYYSNGASIDPFAIGEKTSELVCLLDETDPDDGSLGRNVPIAQVAYTGKDEKAQVSLDDSREDFEAIMSRYALLHGELQA